MIRQSPTRTRVPSSNDDRHNTMTLFNPSLRLFSINFQWLLLAATVFLAPFGQRGNAFAALPQPNLVFIMADDQGIGEVGCYGSKVIATPNIDRLAAEGMKFTRAYRGNAVCAPILAETLRFVETHKDRPFFCYAARTRPHGRYEVPAIASEFAEKPWTTTSAKRITSPHPCPIASRKRRRCWKPSSSTVAARRARLRKMMSRCAVSQERRGNTTVTDNTP
jgi:hypothetical protein